MTKQTAKTTERSLAIINTIQELGGATLDELVDEVDISRSTIHLHLRTLLDKGYLTKEGAVYQIGLRFLNHGEYARSQKRAYTLAKQTVTELSDQIDEEVEFVVENNGRGILVHESFHPDSHIPSKERHLSTAPSAAGIYYDLHCVATGKAILAELPAERVETILDNWGLPRQTANTITERAVLSQELEQIRERGIAFADEEYVDGLREVGRPVKEPDGNVLGAIAIIGPKYRFTDNRYTDELPDILTQYVDELETEIESTYVDELSR
ncbi:IclR family transcription regulator (plasmid) [Natrialba magadii ATCC 43099]|uniref:IclR family transcription regulator n=1 Tax=Natrialba magadii (strain ATCC 43099 / DSM 3394 / CCM 3739 / CIP 104546 / IAM 13178 / JCM 8861 / NBRC 102185 / NCIMB 2190 / MS3) TaxID=547559 RepID=D3T0V4_NATMM|nr:IclR family transcriptional regulator [Natrialba magadii]ADD07213.1 IclR family transcription regulator [Natrialba magadii ATCC 43099]ELY34326.1 IclR family transcriptional regulator [Natrialba magadii ATCC 43099]